MREKILENKMIASAPAFPTHYSYVESRKQILIQFLNGIFMLMSA